VSAFDRPHVPTHPPIPRHHGRGIRRAVSALLAAAVTASVMVVAPAQPAAAASYNQLTFADGAEFQVFGANGAVIIDGVIAYDDGCIYDEGVKDFFYPATDVYLVPTRSVGGYNDKLVDAGGEGPNTIVAFSSGIFLDETIAFTSPAGKLGEGEYDVVYDTCQDGFFNEGDELFSEVVIVEMPETLPSASPAIAQIKDRAREQYASWLQTHTIITALFAADKAKEILSCILLPNPGCLLAVFAHLEDEGQIGARQAAEIQDLASALIMNVAKNHGAIWKDPPDEDFDVLPVLERPVDGDVPDAGQPVVDSLTTTLPALADEAALTDALLHAMERYQGAQAAGDGDWALAQARAARDLSGVLADHLTDSTALADLRTAVAASSTELDQRFAEGRAFANRVRTTGFSPDEERVLTNLGFSQPAINDLEGQQVQAGHVVGYSSQDLVDQLDQVLAARAEMAASLVASAATWDELVTTLESADRTLPAADAGGPYAVTGGGAVTLDGSGSRAATGAALTTYEWDLDADGAFDDATGASPTATFPTEGGQLVSLRVTDDQGRQAVAHAHVAVTGGDQPPVVTSTEPAPAVSVEVEQPLNLGVVASDPEGAPLSFSWTIDGTDLAATGDELAWTPTIDDLGPHSISVVVRDGSSRGTRRTWRVTVTAPDADSDGWTETTDCDDTRADVSPSMYERLGNDLDDDCDTSTLDTPPGGLAGQLWSWGDAMGTGLGTFTNQYLPVPVPSLPAVTDVVGASGKGLAVLSDGTVRAWGYNHRGELGIGVLESRRNPTSVVGVRGAAVLTDVLDVSTQTMHSVALVRGGRVVAWGNNDNGQSGNGSDAAQHLSPVEVVTPDGSPLTGAVAVESGISQQYALLADGRVMSWGAQQCAGQWPYPEAHTAVPVTGLGDDVVQISAGHGMVMARKADGSVWACAGDDELLDRAKGTNAATPLPMRSFGPGSGVIDISSGGDGAIALKADGTVLLWGKNTNSTLGPLGVQPDAIVDRPTPVPLPPGPPVVDVEMDASCNARATRADGTVLSWGCNTNGGAGIGAGGVQEQIHVLGLDGVAFASGAFGYNGFALVRPAADPELEPVMHWIAASAQDAAIDEGVGGTVEIRLSEPALGDVEVTWALGDGPQGTATVPEGATSVAVRVSVTDDALDEYDEELPFHLVAVSDGVEIERGVSLVTVVDDDAAPAVSVSPATVVEGHTALTDATVTVSLSQASGKDVEVLWSTVDGTAVSSAPADFSAGRGHVLVPAGETEAVVHLAVHGDHVLEPVEDFAVVLDQPVNAVPGEGSAPVTVVDDEPVRLSVTSPTMTEGDGPGTVATFTVTAVGLHADTTVEVPWTVATVTAQVAPGLPEQPTDVDAGAGTLVFDATSTSLQVSVAVIGDDLEELTERFRLVLGEATASDGRPVVHGDPTVATILDDDAPVTDPDPEPDPVFDFDGFYAPLDNLPTVNVVQSGRAIPVKFSLGGDRGLDIFESGYPRSVRIPCEAGGTLDAIEETVSPGSSELTYDAGTDTYHYVWKTQKAWKGQCRQLEVRFVDGTEAVAELRFR